MWNVFDDSEESSESRRLSEGSQKVSEVVFSLNAIGQCQTAHVLYVSIA